MLTSILSLFHDWNEKGLEKWQAQQAQIQLAAVHDTALKLRDELFPIFSNGKYSMTLVSISTPFDIRPCEYKKVPAGEVFGFELLKNSKIRILPYDLTNIESRMNQDIALETAPIVANPFFFPFSLLLRQPQIVQIQDNVDSITIFLLLH